MCNPYFPSKTQYVKSVNHSVESNNALSQPDEYETTTFIIVNDFDPPSHRMTVNRGVEGR